MSVFTMQVIRAPGRPRMQTWVGGRLEWADRGSLMPFLLTLYTWWCTRATLRHDLGANVQQGHSSSRQISNPSPTSPHPNPTEQGAGFRGVCLPLSKT